MKNIIEREMIPDTKINNQLAEALAEAELIMNFEATSFKEILSKGKFRLNKEVDVISNFIDSASQEERQEAGKLIIKIAELAPAMKEKIGGIVVKIIKEAAPFLNQEIEKLIAAVNIEQDSNPIFTEEQKDQLLFLPEFIEEFINKIPPEEAVKILDKLGILLKNEKLEAYLLQDLTQTFEKAGNLSVNVLASQLRNDSQEKTKEKIRNYAFVLNKAVLHEKVEKADKEDMARLYIDLLKDPKAEIYYALYLEQGLQNIGEPAVEQLICEINERNLDRIFNFTKPLAGLANKVHPQVIKKALVPLKDILLLANTKFLKQNIQKAIDAIDAIESIEEK